MHIREQEVAKAYLLRIAKELTGLRARLKADLTDRELTGEQHQLVTEALRETKAVVRRARELSSSLELDSSFRLYLACLAMLKPGGHSAVSVWLYNRPRT